MPKAILEMPFKVISPTGLITHCEDEGGGYPDNILSNMQDAGYTFVWNDRPWSPGNVENSDNPEEPTKPESKRKIRANRYIGKVAQICL